MVFNCADLTLSIFLYLTVRSPIWHYNYRMNIRLICYVGKMRIFTRIGIRIIPVVALWHPHTRIIPPAPILQRCTCTYTPNPMNPNRKRRRVKYVTDLGSCRHIWRSSCSSQWWVARCVICDISEYSRRHRSRCRCHQFCARNGAAMCRCRRLVEISHSAKQLTNELTTTSDGRGHLSFQSGLLAQRLTTV